MTVYNTPYINNNPYAYNNPSFGRVQSDPTDLRNPVDLAVNDDTVDKFLKMYNTTLTRKTFGERFIGSFTDFVGLIKTLLINTAKDSDNVQNAKPFLDIQV